MDKKNHLRPRLVGWIAVAAVSGFALVAPALAEDCVQRQIPAGTEIKVRVKNVICASELEVEQELVLEIAADKQLGGYLVFAKGAIVNAVVTKVERNGRGGKAGALKIEILNAEHQGGETADLEADDIDKPGKGRGFFGKLFTLWLGRGEDPCLYPDEVITVKTANSVSACVPRN